MATKTTLHDLHTDVLLCIFEYFTVNELYEKFSEVFPYLTSLLINSHIRLHLRKSIITEIDPAQVISIDLTYLPRISSPSISDFINLRSLILHDVEDPKILVNKPLSQSLEIVYLNISLRHNPDIISPLLQLLTQLSKLKVYILIYPSSYFVVVQEDLLIFSTLLTSVEQVKLDIKCSINCLEKLFEHSPRLRRSQSIVVSNSENSSFLPHDSLFPSIENIFLTWEYIPFRDIITLCKKISNLKQCQFVANDYRYDQDVCNWITWRQFIEHDHILLENLVVNMKPQPYYNGHRRPIHLIRDPYVRLINFKFEPDHWNDIVLEGNYIKPLKKKKKRFKKKIFLI